MDGNSLGHLCSSAEAELLLHCARVQWEPRRVERVRALVHGNLNWEFLMRLAQRNGLSPLLFFHLNKTCGDLAPTGPMSELRNYFRANNAFNLLLTGELVSLLKLFAAQGIPAIAYKGPAMAAVIYGDLALRQFCDLDILVRESDVWQATELLKQKGFEPHFVIPPEKQRAFVHLSYVSLFRRDAGRTIVELHWRTAPRFFGVPLDTESLFSGSQKIDLLGAQVSCPAPADLLLMLSIHGAKDCWEKLEWVSAIAELLRANPEIDWDKLFRHSRDLHCERMLSVALFLAYGLLEAPLPDHIAARIATSKQTVSIAGRVTERFFAAKETHLSFAARLAFHVSLKDRSRDKLSYCSRLAFTTTPIDWATMRLPQPLSFLYLPLRAVRLAKRYGPGARGAHS